MTDLREALLALAADWERHAPDRIVGQAVAADLRALAEFDVTPRGEVDATCDHERAARYLATATVSAEERTKVIDQATLIAQMGGIGDDELVALLCLAAARMMTPSVAERFRALGIEPDPCRVVERIEEARRDPSVQKIIAELATPTGHDHKWQRRQNVTSSGYRMPPYEVCVVDGCDAARQVIEWEELPDE